jgi:hypothetical protein
VPLITPDSLPQTSVASPLIPSSPTIPISPPSFIESEVLSLEPPGFGQSEDVDPTLLDALASSTLPSILPNIDPQLAIYRGKELIRPGVEAGSSSSLGHVKVTKSLAWSRGIGTDLSPLQTISSRKQKELHNSVHSGSDLQIQDGKALRALKALARTK